ncbi:hypothetical protein [Litorilituus sediminis]|uniref:Ig-like domain-containing protein n=1 Tax=Litorilituus sediminis TaxID=718192 RepID=A0A4P6P2F1_9GAMM|nr:hypothetical protein [Litorilituus sediminis]QBG35294.1 hypothetical protein EMK97_05955 [Litorilituus sediminis]
MIAMTKHIFLYFIFITLLTACGGGSDADNNQPTPEPAPIISSFTASKTTIMAGETIELFADFSNGTASIDNGVGTISSNTPVSIIPENNTTYMLTVTNSAGVTVTAQVAIEIILPEIISFSVSASEILAGDKVKIIADFSHGTASIDNNVGEITSGIEKTIFPETTTIYTLTVTNDYGVSTTQTITVEVVPLLVNIFVPNTITDTSVPVGVTIESTFEINEITASIEELTTQLEFVPTGNGGYYGSTIYLTGKPDGEYTLTVTATDIFAGSNTATKTIIMDNPPSITLTTPLEGTVATPELSINLSCDDNVSDTEITVRATTNWQDGNILTTGVNQIQGTFDLSAYEGQAVTLNTECKDSSNQLTSTSTSIFVESSNILRTIKDFSTAITDYDNSRALVHKTNNNNASLAITNINSNNDETVDVPSNVIIVDSMLTPTGAVYQAVNSDWNYEPRHSLAVTYDWNNGELLNLGWTGSVSAAGNYLSYIQNDSLWQRNLLTKANTWMSSISTHRYENENDYSLHDISGNGTVVYNISAQGYVSDIKKNDNNSVTTFSFGRDPLTDGTISVYLKVNRVTNTTLAIAMHDGNNEVMLTDSYDYDSFDPEPHTYYAVNNGWVAYTNLGSTEQTHVWTRDTQGTLAQRTFFSSDSLIDTLADNGELMLIHDNKRYLSKPNEELILIGSSLGKSKYINGKWYIAIGRTLFQINLD